MIGSVPWALTLLVLTELTRLVPTELPRLVLAELKFGPTTDRAALQVPH